MSRKRTQVTVSVILLLGTANLPARGDFPVPDTELSTATMENYNGVYPLVMRHLPDGSGTPFEAAISVEDRSTHDATITLQVLDSLGYPMINYPYPDMWLETTDGSLSFCSGYAFADHHTDVNGETTWTGTLRTGGHDGGEHSIVTYVVISGEPLAQPGFALWHNSPDINGDGYVNVTDVQIFSVDYFAFAADPANYDFRSDFEYDGAVNVSDIVPLAQGQGHNCP